MKKYVFLLVCILLLQMSVFARTATKEDLMELIDSFENIQVDDNVKILSMKVQKEKIEVTLLENDLPEIRYIPYEFKDNALTFTGGEINKDTKEVKENQYAFYLYAILESKSTAPYDESNYYNESFIKNKISEVEDKKTYQNSGKTFGVVLEKKGNNNYQVKYEYYLDGDDIIYIPKVGTTADFTNPDTGNFNVFVTITLFLVIGLAAYTVWGSDKLKEMRSH